MEVRMSIWELRPLDHPKWQQYVKHPRVLVRADDLISARETADRELRQLFKARQILETWNPTTQTGTPARERGDPGSPWKDANASVCFLTDEEAASLLGDEPIWIEEA